MATDEKVLAGITLRTAQRNLETAELTHKKISETISIRTATVAQMAATILTSGPFGSMKALINNSTTPALAAVKLAEELMVAAEESAAKAKELQASLESIR
jgi:hypothetical protein